MHHYGIHIANIGIENDRCNRINNRYHVHSISPDQDQISVFARRNGADLRIKTQRFGTADSSDFQKIPNFAIYDLRGHPGFLQFIVFQAALHLKTETDLCEHVGTVIRRNVDA